MKRSIFGLVVSLVMFSPHAFAGNADYRRCYDNIFGGSMFPPAHAVYGANFDAKAVLVQGASGELTVYRFSGNTTVPEAGGKCVTDKSKNLGDLISSGLSNVMDTWSTEEHKKVSRQNPEHAAMESAFLRSTLQACKGLDAQLDVQISKLWARMSKDFPEKQTLKYEPTRKGDLR